MQHTVHEARKEHIGTRQLANIVYGGTQCHSLTGNWKEALFAVLARAAELRLGDFNVQELANTAWAFATASQQDAQLFAALARAAELRLGDFNVQSLANTAWAFATSSQQDAQVFAALARSPPLVWHGRLPPSPGFPSLPFWTNFSTIF